MARFGAEAGLGSHFYILPTSILVAEPRGTRLLPTSGGAPSLHRMAALSRVADRVASGRLDPVRGLGEVRRLEAEGPFWGPGMQLAAHAGAAAFAAPLMGGGVRELVVAAAVGMTAGAVASAAERRPSGAALAELLAATMGTLTLALVGRAIGGADPGPALLAGLIVLLPGFRLTVGMTELATRHLISGTGGLVSAGMTLLQLAVGVALGSALGGLESLPVDTATPLPEWVGWLVLPGLALAFGVLLDARRTQLSQVFVALAAALAGATAGSWVLGPLGGLLAACVVTVVANGLANTRNQPAAVVLVPGILLLVPGSIGFRAVRALLEQDVVAGVEGTFSMVLAAVTLVAGTLVGNALIPPRRGL
jgi:uncharacterized membrane protein YjjP (DUF1212 family)